MDRQIVYPGSIPLDTDFLSIQRGTLSAIGSLARAVFGGSAVADGLLCTPGPSGYSVIVGSGTLSQILALDAASFGSLLPDATPIMKMGVNTSETTIALSATPNQANVLCWLIQASLQDVDDQALALQYWNAADPTIPYSGPNNSGAAQNTRRRTQLVLSAKPSAPVPIGTYAPPSADVGAVGLYTVTTWIGKSGVTSDDIRVVPSAPLLQYHLPDLVPGFSRQAVIGSTQTWSVPAGVYRLRVRVIGGGGGGGGGSNAFGGGGGGAGGYAEGVVSVSPGQTLPLTVGAGGAGGNPGATGGSGGTTAFGGAVVASGGQGGASANPDSHGGSGGGGAAGTLLISGGTGGDGSSTAGIPAGNGGSGRFGGGGRGSNGGGVPANGTAPGSGAGGSYGTSAPGGTGAPGLIIIEF